jgi:dihydrofolate synthase/folylpolyglutamate synthase
MDFATSTSPAVQAQLDRLGALSVPQGRLGLATIRALLARLGDPHLALPPVFHVAGTNGKGSSCAFLRAMLEAEGYKVHATTSPHLVRYNERIRVAGELISDDRLAQLLAEVLDAGADLNPSFFEVTIAAAFTEFARVRADACVVEVGLGGRFDATNVIERPLVCGIAALGIDHERFLLAPEDGVPNNPIARIAFEKAGIAKPGVPLVTMGECYPDAARAVIAAITEKTGSPLREYGPGWCCDGFNAGTGRLFYRERYREGIDVPAPSIPGEHQYFNAGLAIAMLRSQSRLRVGEAAIAQGLRTARWPARLQRLSQGPLTMLVPGRAIWLDGGHNPSAGETLAEFFREPIHLIIGMLEAKDPQSIVGPLRDRIRSLTVVAVPGHDWHPAARFGPGACAAAGVEQALLGLPADGYCVLVAGSLYLAGEVLRLNGELPD